MTAKTVFVIGAGASCEYGFPSGIALKAQISELLGKLESPTQYDEVMSDAIHLIADENTVGGAQKFVVAATQISKALPLALSIDNYLHTHNGDTVIEQLGKLAIVRTILAAERKSKLFFKDQDKFSFSEVEDTWLSKLMQLLNESNTIHSLKERLSSITFVVFNYDRCIEHFLFNAIRIFYGVTWEEAAVVAKLARIYHPYGTVGKYPFNNSSQALGTPYGADLQQHSLIEVAGKIKTFTEGTDDRLSDIKAIRNHISNASKLIFLGFAFHPINIELLAREEDAEVSYESLTFATAYRMSESNIRLIDAEVTGKITGVARNEFRNMKCAEFFDEYSRTFRFG
jgi:hypothetical protein